MSVITDPILADMLEELHARSDEQAAAMAVDSAARSKVQYPAEERAALAKAYLRDKLVALDRDKAAFCHQLCRATGARRIVEVGTSHGLSTLYLAAALRDTLAAEGGSGFVIGTEYEPEKVHTARQHFSRARLSHLIDLREGDLRDTLVTIEESIDFVLIDVWVDMARPAIELLAPRLRPGAIVICDNTEKFRSAYSDYFTFLNSTINRFQTLTMPYNGGLELSIKC